MDSIPDAAEDSEPKAETARADAPPPVAKKPAPPPVSKKPSPAGAVMEQRSRLNTIADPADAASKVSLVSFSGIHKLSTTTTIWIFNLLFFQNGRCSSQ